MRRALFIALLVTTNAYAQKPDANQLVDPFANGDDAGDPLDQATPPAQAPANSKTPRPLDGQLVDPFERTPSTSPPPTRGVPIDPYAPPPPPGPVAPPPEPPLRAPVHSEFLHDPNYNPNAPAVPSGAGEPPSVLPRKKTNQRFVRFALGFGYRRALGEDLYGANPEIAIGVSDAHWGGGGQFDLLAGRLSSGLEFQWMHVGPVFYFQPVHGFHLGAGASLGWIVIQRFTRDTDPLWSLSIGFHLTADVDLTHDSQHGGLFLQGKVGYDVLTQTTDLSLNSLLAGVSLGYRFQ